MALTPEMRALVVSSFRKARHQAGKDNAEQDAQKIVATLKDAVLLACHADPSHMREFCYAIGYAAGFMIGDDFGTSSEGTSNASQNYVDFLEAEVLRFRPDLDNDYDALQSVYHDHMDRLEAERAIMRLETN